MFYNYLNRVRLSLYKITSLDSNLKRLILFSLLLLVFSVGLAIFFSTIKVYSTIIGTSLLLVNIERVSNPNYKGEIYLELISFLALWIFMLFYISPLNGLIYYLF